MKADIVNGKIVFYPESGTEQEGIKTTLERFNTETVTDFKLYFSISPNLIKDLDMKDE